LGSVVIQLYAGECTPSVHRALAEQKYRDSEKKNREDFENRKTTWKLWSLPTKSGHLTALVLLVPCAIYIRNFRVKCIKRDLRSKSGLFNVCTTCNFVKIDVNFEFISGHWLQLSL